MTFHADLHVHSKHSRATSRDLQLNETDNATGERRLWYRALLERLRAKDPDRLATQLQLLFEGGLAAALVHGDPAVARAARAAAEVLLDADRSQSCSVPGMTQKVSVPSGKEDERGSKRRLRSIKRIGRGPNAGREGAPIAAPAGQRRAVRGNRLRQRRT